MYNQINNDINFDENNGTQTAIPPTPQAQANKPINKLQQGVKKVISGISAIKQLANNNEKANSNTNNDITNQVNNNNTNQVNNDNIEVVMTNSFKEETNVLLEIIEANKPVVIEKKPIEDLMNEIEKKCDEISQESTLQEENNVVIVEDNLSVLTQETNEIVVEEKVVEEPIKKRGRPKKNK